MNTPSNFRKFKKMPLAAAAFFFLIAAAAFAWMLRAIDGNKARAATARAEWQAETARRYEIQSLGITLEDTQEARQALDMHFAQSSNIVPFLDSLEGLARSAGASAKVISVDAPADTGSLIATLQAHGSFESLYTFLALLEESPYPLEFLTVDIGASAAAEGPRWEAVFKLKLLSFVP